MNSSAMAAIESNTAATTNSTPAIMSILLNTLGTLAATNSATTSADALTTQPPTATLGSYMFDGLMLSKFNSTLNLQANDIVYSVACLALFSAIYLAILVGGMFGNVLVCYVVVRNRAMQTVTNMFITNLAVSDILMSLLCLPFTPAYMYMRYWPFGMLMCHTVVFAQTTSVYVSTFTLTAIALDRYLVIMHPFKQRMRMRLCLSIIVGIWLLSLLLSSPFGIYQHEVPINITGTWNVYCEENWLESERLLFATGTAIVQFVLPFVIIAYCYTCVSVRLNERARARPGNKASGRKDEVDRDRKRRTNRMLVYMVVVFGLVWLPLNTINLLNDWYIVNADELEYYNMWFIMAHLLAMSSTCYNPVLYAWKNDNFRKEFQLVLPCYKAAIGMKTLPDGAGGGGSGGGGRQGGSQRWQQTGQTCTGNNETMQESLLTSSCVRSTCLSAVFSATATSAAANGGGGAINGAVLTGDATSSDDHIRLSDIEPGVGGRARSTRNGPETHVLPSGVLETNFEEAYGGLPDRTAPKVCRIRFEEDLPEVVPSKVSADCIA